MSAGRGIGVHWKTKEAARPMRRRLVLLAMRRYPDEPAMTRHLSVLIVLFFEVRILEMEVRAANWLV
jgi:hypothetical protein